MTIPLDIRERVFIPGLNWVGDAIIATPALRKLRQAFKGSHITLMVRPWVAAIYENNPDIDELWVEDDSISTAAFLKVAKRVRQGKFNFGIALPNSFRSALLLTLGQIKHRVGYARGKRSLLFTRPVPVDPKILQEHQIYYYLHLIDWLTEQKPEPPKLVLKSGEKERLEIARMIEQRGWKEWRMWIGIAPGSINSMAKRWLPERFAEVADRISNEVKGQVFLLGTAGEKDVIDKVASLCKTPVINLAGELNLGQLIAFTEKLHAFIGNDSGAMHVAAALDVPTIAIFGPTDWKTTAPFSTKARLVRHPVDCSPCMLRTCPIAHPCMTGVRVEDVIRSFADLAPQIKSRIKTLPGA